METTNLSGSIRIDLTPDYARQINKGFWKRSQEKGLDIIEKIKSMHGVSGVWYTDDKNSEVLATIKVRNPDEGEKIAATISGYTGVKTVRISLGPAGPPPPPPSP